MRSTHISANNLISIRFAYLPMVSNVFKQQDIKISSVAFCFFLVVTLRHEGLNFNSNFSPGSHVGKLRRTLRTGVAVKRKGCRFF